MGRRRKPVPESDTPESIARRNIETRLVAMFPKAKTETKRFEFLDRLSGVGQETIRSFMKAERSLTLKNLVAIADAIGLTMPELFTSNAAQPQLLLPPARKDTTSEPHPGDAEILQRS